MEKQEIQTLKLERDRYRDAFRKLFNSVDDLVEEKGLNTEYELINAWSKARSFFLEMYTQESTNNTPADDGCETVDK